MKKVLLRNLFILLLTVFLCHFTYGENTEMSKGGIVGRIVGDDLLSLPGATVFIAELGKGAVADADGFYRIFPLEAGEYTLSVSYIGYEDIQETLEVKVDIVEHDFRMNPSILLGEVVVTGYSQGQAKALSQQKTSININNIVSADQVGRFPDANIGDALKRIPGINVQYDQGEARFGHVRGTPPEFNSVTVNGDRVPSAEAETRSVQLDLVPSDMIQTVEVNKVVTPDMDADAIGGSINLITKSNPYKRRISATLGGGWNCLMEKMQYTAGALYGDRFYISEDSSLGMIFSFSYQKNELGSDNIEAEWEKSESGNAYMSDFQQRIYNVMRERKSFSAALDYKLNNNNKIELKGIFNRRKDWENRYRLRYKDIEQQKDGSWIAEIRRQTKGGVRDTKFRRLEEQESMDFALKGTHHFGVIDLDWKASYAKASEERPHERYISFRAKKVKINPDISVPKKPFVYVLDKSVANLSPKFSLKELTEEFKYTDDIDKNVKIDVKIPILEGEYASKLKVGGRYKNKEKRRTNRFYDYEPVDETLFFNSAYSTRENESRSDFMAGSKYQAGSFANRTFLANLNLSDKMHFTETENLEEESGNFDAKEEVFAAYIRYDQKIGEKMKIVAGVRMESTKLDYSGSKLTINKKGEAVSLDRIKGKTDNYLNILPSFIAKYKFGKDTQIKFAWTNTIARPKYYSLVPHSTINLEDLKINIGNPDLKATKSMNLDFMAEHYFSNVGMISGGVFFKKITDFIVDQRFRDYTYENRVWDKFIKPINGGNARLYGFELALHRKLDFLPGFLKYFGVYANYTYTKSEVEDFQIEGREKEKLSLPGTPENTFNFSLFYETKRLSVRTSVNYSDDFIDEVNKSTFFDRYYDKAMHLDLNANYSLNKEVNLFVEFNNLLNQPLRYYQGESKRVMQEEYYGLKVNFGLKVNL